ncbi:hypothetical protein MLD38_038282 [Melastoma candidum]|uniref:Uncharacterized protein n=1 Tax=Melastoma candidum TaxID=119954 RepID=A0ACB9KZ15_9MYRT|nr:hypothetical protein MLD38_038282 [Melastoma candidum]
MGIKDLLRFMKPYLEPVHIKKYAGKRVGIDAFSWLHKGAYSCSMELCLNSDGDRKLQYLNYFMHRINMLRHYKVRPVVVLDGGSIPCKAATQDDRERRRKASRDLAMEKLEGGDVQAASELFQRGVSITSTMAYRLIQELKAEDIEFIVAPYEADAQLAYLSSLEAEKGGIAAVITEDSDLVAYGCQAIIFKMDRYGNGEELALKKVFESKDIVPSFQNFSMELFTGMCVLAGCDFLPSVPGIGIKKAFSLVTKYQNLDRVLSVLRFEKGKQMPEDYPKLFQEAVAVFQHARIYDSKSKKLKHLKPLSGSVRVSLPKELDFLGPEISPSMATAIAQGKVDPITMEAYSPSQATPHKLSLLNTVRVSSRQQQNKRVAVDAPENNFLIFSVESDPMDVGAFGLEKRKFRDEAAKLETMVMHAKSTSVAESMVDLKILPVIETPNNNPFKIRKVEEAVLTATDAVHQVKTCRKQEPEESLADQVDGSVEHSTVTELGNPTPSIINIESQESIASKVDSLDSKYSSKHDSKRGKSNYKNSGKRGTILNFFCRI